jgi:hypothetical protein
MKWYRLAADQGNAAAQTALGVVYANGLGVPQDQAKAVECTRKAADQGYANAQNNLGNMASPPCCSVGSIPAGSVLRSRCAPRSARTTGSSHLRRRGPCPSVYYRSHLVDRTGSGSDAAGVRLCGTVHCHDGGRARADFGRRLGPSRAGGGIAPGRPWPCARAGIDFFGVFRTRRYDQGAAGLTVWLLYPLPLAAAGDARR